MRNTLEFIGTFLLFAATMVAIVVFMCLLPQPAGAQEPRVDGTPDAVIQAINQKGGAFTPCITAIVGRETGNTFDPHVQNPYSGAYGAPQFLPTGGVYGVTIPGRSGIPVTALSGPQQIDAMVSVFPQYRSAWAPLPSGC